MRFNKTSFGVGGWLPVQVDIQSRPHQSYSAFPSYAVWAWDLQRLLQGLHCYLQTEPPPTLPPPPPVAHAVPQQPGQRRRLAGTGKGSEVHVQSSASPYPVRAHLLHPSKPGPAFQALYLEVMLSMSNFLVWKKMHLCHGPQDASEDSGTSLRAHIHFMTDLTKPVGFHSHLPWTWHTSWGFTSKGRMHWANCLPGDVYPTFSASFGIQGTQKKSSFSINLLSFLELTLKTTELSKQKN